MTKKISGISISRLKNAAHFELVTRFYGVVNDYETSNEMFQSAKTGLLNAIRKEDEMLMLFQSSEWTQVMVKNQKKRDNNYKAIVDCIRAWERNEDSKYYADAMALRRYIKLYKIVPSRTQMDSLTGEYRTMITDFTMDGNLQKVKNVGAEEFLNGLILSNSEFCKALNERNKEISQVESTLQEARVVTDDAFKEMIDAINSLYYLERDEKLAEIINSCNADFQRIKVQILNRKKKTEGEATTPDTPVEQPTETPCGETPCGEAPNDDADQQEMEKENSIA